MSNQYRAHQNSVETLRIELSKRLPYGRLIDNHTGVFLRRPDWNKVIALIVSSLPVAQKVIQIKRLFVPITINKKGTPDNLYVVTVKGIPASFYIETKTGSATQTKEQKEFEEKCNLLGWIYILNTDPMATADILEMHVEQMKARVA